MSALEELNTLLSDLEVPVETGIFSDAAYARYAVLVPLTDTFDLHADNRPGVDIQEVRISLYAKDSYTRLKNSIIRELLRNDFTITDRMYIGFEMDTGYHHYNVDVAKYYEMEEE